MNELQLSQAMEQLLVARNPRQMAAAAPDIFATSADRSSSGLVFQLPARLKLTDLWVPWRCTAHEGLRVIEQLRTLTNFTRNQCHL